MAETKEITREEKYAAGSFEWVKTERAGTICKFKNFKTMADEEYIVFTDKTKIKSTHIGNVVMFHAAGEEPLLGDYKAPVTEPGQPSPVAPPVTVAPVAAVPEEIPMYSNPVTELLDKAKTTEVELTLKLKVQLPKSDLYKVIVANFDDGEDTIVDYVISKVSSKEIKNAMIDGIANAMK